MTKKTLKAWFLLFRPWSYTATLVPFLIASGLTSFRGNLLYWGLGLISGLFFQATVNLLNTWGDECSGVDNVPGAIRTTPQVHDGLVSMRAVLTAALVCAFVASVLGVALCFYKNDVEWQFNKVLFVCGIIGCLGSLNYSTGIKFKYRGLGVPFVSFLMGPLEMFVAFCLLCPEEVAVEFSADMIQNCGVSSLGFFAFFIFIFSFPIASLVGVIMHGNDMRDMQSDRAAGIVTLASWMGAKGALVYYWLCHLVPYAVISLIAGYLGICWYLSGEFRLTLCCGAFLFPFGCLPLTIKTLRTATAVYRASPQNPQWRGLERASGKIHFVFGILYAASYCVVHCLLQVWNIK